MRPGTFGKNLNLGVEYVRKVTIGGGFVSVRMLQNELSVSHGTANKILTLSSLHGIVVPVKPENKTCGIYSRKKYVKQYRNIIENGRFYNKFMK